MTRVPEGYDAVCTECLSPYTFANAKAVDTANWQHFCSNVCDERNSGHDEFRRAFGAWWRENYSNRGPAFKACAWAAFQAGAAAKTGEKT